MHVSVTVNGEVYDRDTLEYRTLLEFLRVDLGLTGTKEGCAAGECGACTVVYNGELVNACMILAAEIDGATIATIEGQAEDGRLTPLQEAFGRHHAIQCGFCTPGMIMQAVDLVTENPHPTEAEVREGLEGNLCRCTGYHNIVKAVQQGAGAMSGGQS